MTDLTNVTLDREPCGFSVPTREDLMPGMRPMRGMHVDTDSGEAVFIPMEHFMQQSPLWRLDVFGDIADDIERVRRHALVEYFNYLGGRVPGMSVEESLERFWKLCRSGGIELPRNAEAVLAIANALKSTTRLSPD